MAFTENWSDILTTQVDADSPINETLMQSIRSDLIHIKEALGQNYTLAPDHDHDGANSALIASVGAAAVGQAQLKTATATGSLALTSSQQGSIALTGGTYSWWTASSSVVGSKHGAQYGMVFGNGNTAAGIIGLTGEVGSSSLRTFYIDERYIQASPPYSVGGNRWNHFVYVMRNSIGEILGYYEAPDPTWMHHGDELIIDKNSPLRMKIAPHPFATYWNRNPGVDGLEIALLDIRDKDFNLIKKNAKKNKRKPFTELIAGVQIDLEMTAAERGFPDIAGLTNVMKFRKVV